ncbi:hypothetical protein EUX98_g7659 [Antrodiella citrinella]|uniref:Arrestin-like N-terminal domain-containing protein n=1 Tax=Antrodiella citrinella TaxID=2447956 RepID=A0A4S4MLA8_9APHY|nr:hypothetical protein EUX98_g7659 [Antrodiella citrinella]
MSIATPHSAVLDLPSYSPSSSAPHYSPEPSEDECRLVFVARKQRDLVPTDVFAKKAGGVTLLISGQDSGVVVPTYNRNGIVRGEVLLDDEAAVQSVSVKLEGSQSTSIVDGGADLVELFSESLTVWSKPRSDIAGPSTLTPPAVLPFAIPFPKGYGEGQSVKPLPPTFNAQFSGTHGIYVECKYILTVTVTKSGLGGWKRQKLLTTPVSFEPRSRAYMPIGRDLLPFFSTIKSAPGDWHQVISKMEVQPKSTLEPLECQLFVPAVQIYAFSDIIPFHLHLRGSRASLASFVAGPTPVFKLPKGIKALSSTLKLGSSSRTSLDSSSSSFMDVLTPQVSPVGHDSSNVRVYLLRQVCVSVDGQKAWGEIVLGEGKISPLSSTRAAGTDGEYSLDWEGEVRCGSAVSVGSFRSGELVVKDFIVVELKPPVGSPSPLKYHRHAHPIRLVTDSCSDSL